MQSGIFTAALGTIQAVDGAVVPVLDVVVAADPSQVVLKAACNLGPFLAQGFDLSHDEVALHLVDGLMLQIGPQVLHPALAALLGTPSEHLLGDIGPVEAGGSRDNVREPLVLSFRPRALDRLPSSALSRHFGGGGTKGKGK